ncbi:MAG: hypothetical protein WBP93_04405 [Pyrinomonadaceae bacterium]
MRMLVVTLVSLLLVFQASAQKQKSDREDAGLKGKVKTLATEVAYISNQSGTWVEGKRQPSATESYDINGNLTKRDSYDYMGNPFQSSVYSYIDGDRVVSTHNTHIQHDYDPPPSVSATPRPNQVSSTSNPQYTGKLKYKYDDKGNRTEIAWYRNDGSLAVRDVSVFNPKGNRVEMTSYEANGSMRRKATYIYDAQGNITETLYHSSRPLDERYSYTYEFDAKGNWIKRKTFKWVTKNGRSYFEPYEVTYRTIAYY